MVFGSQKTSSSGRESCFLSPRGCGWFQLRNFQHRGGRALSHKCFLMFNDPRVPVHSNYSSINIYHKPNSYWSYICQISITKLGHRCVTCQHARASPYMVRRERMKPSSLQNLCWLMIIGDYTTQYIGDYNNPIYWGLQ